MTVPLYTGLSHLGLAKETTQGTAVAPTEYIPVTALSPSDDFERISDDSIDANRTATRGIYEGVKDSSFTFGGMAFDLNLGHLFNALGLIDTISGAGPYLHTHKLPSSGAQPPAYTLTDFNGVEARAYPGQVLESLDLTVDMTGATKYSAKWKGWASATASTPTPSFPTAAPFINWQAAVTIGGSASTKVLSVAYNLKQAVAPIHTLSGTQNPRTVWAGGVDCGIKVKALFEDNGEINRYLNNTQAAFVVTLTQPSAGAILTLTTTKAVWTKASLADRGSGNYVALEAELDAVYNTTDGGPIAVTLSNTRATAY